MNIYIFFGGGGYQKMKFFGGMKIVWIFFGSSQNWTNYKGRLYSFLISP